MLVYARLKSAGLGCELVCFTLAWESSFWTESLPEVTAVSVIYSRKDLMDDTVLEDDVVTKKPGEAKSVRDFPVLNIQDRKEVGRGDPTLQTEHLFPNKKSDAP